MKGKVIHFCWLLIIACLCMGNVYDTKLPGEKIREKDTRSFSKESIFTEKNSLFTDNTENFISRDEEETAAAPPTFPGDGDYNPGGTIGNTIPIEKISPLIGMGLFYLIYSSVKKKKNSL